MRSVKANISLNGNLCMPSNRGEKLIVFPQWLKAGVLCWFGALGCSDHTEVNLRCQE